MTLGIFVAYALDASGIQIVARSESPWVKIVVLTEKVVMLLSCHVTAAMLFDFLSRWGCAAVRHSRLSTLRAINKLDVRHLENFS